MNNPFQELLLCKIKKYARENSGEESCGVIVRDLAGFKFFPCENLSLKKDSHFFIDPYILVENNVACIYHSHVSQSSEPSTLDKKTSNELCIPYLIYSLKDDDFYFYNCVH